MTEERPATRKYAERQAAFVAVATRHINQRGVSGMTLADVAAEQGVAPKVIAYYFKRKEDLAAACFLRSLERIRAFAKAGESGRTASERLSGMFELYFDYRRRAVEGEVEELASPNDIRALDSAAVNEAYAALFRQVRDLLTEPGRDIPKLDLHARTHLVFAQLNWAGAWLRNIFPEDYGRVARRAMDILLNGLAAPGRPWAPQILSILVFGRHQTQDAAIEPFLRAATQLINEQGYNGASVEKISAKLNLTKGAFYHHIQTKDELVVACFERTFARLRRALAAAEALPCDALTRLQTFSAALVREQLSGGPALLRTSAVTTLPEPLQARMMDDYDRIALRLSGMVSDGIADGSIRPVEANVAAQILMATINLADELPFFVRDISADQADASYVRPVFFGLSSPPGFRA